MRTACPGARTSVTFNRTEATCPLVPGECEIHMPGHIYGEWMNAGCKLRTDLLLVHLNNFDNVQCFEASEDFQSSCTETIVHYIVLKP